MAHISQTLRTATPSPDLLGHCLPDSPGYGTFRPRSATHTDTHAQTYTHINVAHYRSTAQPTAASWLAGNADINFARRTREAPNPLARLGGLACTGSGARARRDRRIHTSPSPAHMAHIHTCARTHTHTETCTNRNREQLGYL